MPNYRITLGKELPWDVLREILKKAGEETHWEPEEKIYKTDVSLNGHGVEMQDYTGLYFTRSTLRKTSVMQTAHGYLPQTNVGIIELTGDLSWKEPTRGDMLEFSKAVYRLLRQEPIALNQ